MICALTVKYTLDIKDMVPIKWDVKYFIKGKEAVQGRSR